MFDAWMNLWTKGPETMVNGWTAMNDAVPSVTDGDMPMWLTSMSTPVMRQPWLVQLLPIRRLQHGLAW